MVVTLGDGSYLFNTPLSAHHVAMAEKLPIVVVVFDDSAWSTIKKSTRGSHPDGHAVRTGRFALCDFPRSIDFAKVAEAAGGIGVRVEKPGDLPGALRDAIERSRKGDQLILLDVICERDA
jgi:thiamine pyrophosphate-dependent acetolactate synthase large subunit-like protein